MPVSNLQVIVLLMDHIFNECRRILLISFISISLRLMSLKLVNIIDTLFNKNQF